MRKLLFQRQILSSFAFERASPGVLGPERAMNVCVGFTQHSVGSTYRVLA
jgi:hypothetical protein